MLTKLVERESLVDGGAVKVVVALERLVVWQSRYVRECELDDSRPCNVKCCGNRAEYRVRGERWTEQE